jgi:hypothetical protein
MALPFIEFSEKKAIFMYIEYVLRIDVNLEFFHGCRSCTR